ncbi:odorant receptor 42b [Drosophila grimshawi]|uniref:Odorant receptor n=1 Tax=Drosophila grimshawi TaxID=7222 RepID=B4JA92_DROGR|nr:odorant receptor 42b [Drosophila grimshawi]XP_032592218.1 odorant receptor 42b [Drosophila grimshawi]XP_032592219.1 odorant receptor 42b [Drosophila grimshawi]XP_043070479.1 odorant receptor 42b [Drosophila grimshawi]EDW03766.1 GH10324 [Drosophila grimshawi]
MIYKLFPRLGLWPLKEVVKSRDAFVYLDRGMTICGWMPPEGKYQRWIYGVWTVIFNTFAIVLLDVSLLVSYFKEFHTFTAGQFLTSLQVGFDCFGSSIKSGYTFAGVKRFKQAKKILDRLDDRCTSDEQRSQLQQTVASCNQCYMAYQILYSSYTASTFLAGTCTGRLPWKLYNPLIDWEASYVHFWLAAIFEYVWMTGVVLQNQMSDVYPIVHFLMIRTHINLLKERLERLRSDPTVSEQNNYVELTKCIEDHQLILDYCNTLRPVVSGTIFVQFLLCGVVIGLAMINIVYFSNFWTGLGTAIFLFDLLLQTFPFCYICNMIGDDCGELANNLFHSNWQGAPRYYTATLRYFLHNLQEPIVLTAGGIFIISMATNITVAKLAFSVVTFVEQLNIAEKFQTK